MKMGLGVIAGVVLGVVILVAGGALLLKYAVNQASPTSNQLNQPTPAPLLNLPSVPAQQPTVTKPIVTAPAPSTAASTSSSNSSKVNFDVRITNFTGNGLTRSITAQITNTGNLDAHNVVGKVEVLSGGKQITITSNGQTSISQALGTIKAAQTVDTQLDLTFGFLDGLTLVQNGATVNLIITSDEKIQTITYDYKP
jgi:hypothetical protein